MIRTLLKPLSFIPALLLMYMIFSFSSQPAEVSSQLSYKVSYKMVEAADYVFDAGLEEWQIGEWANKIHFITRKLAHMAEYFALAVAVSFPLYVCGLHGILLMLVAGIICVGFACGDEYHQAFVAGRGPSVKDVCIDSVGVFFGIIFVRIIGWTGRKTIFKPREKTKKAKVKKTRGKQYIDDPYNEDGYPGEPYPNRPYGRNGYPQPPYGDGGYQEPPYGPDDRFRDAAYRQPNDYWGEDDRFQDAPFRQNGRYQETPYQQNGRYRETPYPQDDRFRKSSGQQDGRFREAPYPQDDNYRKASYQQDNRFQDAPYQQDDRFRGAPYPQDDRFREAPYPQDGRRRGASSGTGGSSRKASGRKTSDPQEDSYWQANSYRGGYQRPPYGEDSYQTREDEWFDEEDIDIDSAPDASYDADWEDPARADDWGMDGQPPVPDWTPPRRPPAPEPEPEQMTEAQPKRKKKAKKEKDWFFDM